MQQQRSSLVPGRWFGGLTRRGEDDPFQALHREIDNLFEDFWKGGRVARDRLALNPSVDVHETEKEIVVSVELPGIDEKDIDVEMGDNALTIRGEKKSEADDKKKDYYVSERSYGRFERRLALPAYADRENAQASFEKGLLTITVPKRAEPGTAAKKIRINGH